jgi:hypothetical protein
MGGRGFKKSIFTVTSFVDDPLAVSKENDKFQIAKSQLGMGD